MDVEPTTTCAPNVARQLVTQAGHARHRGYSRQSIFKMVMVGEIPTRDIGKIHAAETDFALKEGRDP